MNFDLVVSRPSSDSDTRLHISMALEFLASSENYNGKRRTDKSLSAVSLTSGHIPDPTPSENLVGVRYVNKARGVKAKAKANKPRPRPSLETCKAKAKNANVNCRENDTVNLSILIHFRYSLEKLQ